MIAGTERDEKARLSALRSIGFPTLTVGPDLPPLHEQVKDHFGEEADAHIEASGASPVLADAWQSLKMNGIVTVVALYGSKVDFDVTQFVRRQIDVRVNLRLFQARLPKRPRSSPTRRCRFGCPSQLLSLGRSRTRLPPRRSPRSTQAHAGLQLTGRDVSIGHSLLEPADLGSNHISDEIDLQGRQPRLLRVHPERG